MRAKRGVAQRGSVRLISGKWGGRVLSFPSIDGLRPTLGSQRETLFNWLRPIIRNSRCLDLFAGSGALGFEAASGGADSVFLVEKSKKIYLSLLSNAELLNAENCRIFHTTAQSFLERYPEQFDIFFLDPPFSNPEILEKTVSLVEERLSEGQLIYLEGSNIKFLKELCQKHSLNIYKESSGGQRAGILAEKRIKCREPNALSLR
jgi:16S rRNA (guanine966-N2)-methyltransferase